MIQYIVIMNIKQVQAQKGSQSYLSWYKSRDWHCFFNERFFQNEKGCRLEKNKKNNEWTKWVVQRNEKGLFFKTNEKKQQQKRFKIVRTNENENKQKRTKILLNELFYWMIVQCKPVKKRWKMKDNFESEQNQLFLNDWKKWTKWVVHKRWRNKMKKVKIDHL